MKTSLFLALILLSCLAAPATVGAQSSDILFRDDFQSLENWRPQHFPKIKVHSTYTIETKGRESYLKGVSRASASGLIFKETFDVYEYPRIRWRWKVGNIYAKGDARTKEGDDYPLRIYIVFEYNPKEAGFGERVKYNLAKVFYGEYPPHSSLNYIWANKEHEEDIIASAYTSRSMMILLEKGPARVGQWVVEEVDILADYRKAFGTDPPQEASIAIMTDADNTGEEGVGYLDYIEVYR